MITDTLVERRDDEADSEGTGWARAAFEGSSDNHKSSNKDRSSDNDRNRNSDRNSGNDRNRSTNSTKKSSADEDSKGTKKSSPEVRKDGNETKSTDTSTNEENKSPSDKPDARPGEAAVGGKSAGAGVKSESAKTLDSKGSDAKANEAAGNGGEQRIDKNVKLEGTDLKRANYLQDTLKSLAPIYLEPIPGSAIENPGSQERADQARKQVEEVRSNLKKERDAQIFGPATQDAYRRYVEWLQKSVPQTIRELDSLQLSIPPGSPISLDSDGSGRTVDPRLYKALAADERLSLQLALKPGELPTDEQLDKLDNVYNFLARSNQSIGEARGNQRDAALDKVITGQGLPTGWRKKPGDDPAAWRASAEEMVDLSVRTGNYIEAMQSLYKASRNNDFPLEVPKGTILSVADTSGKMHYITYNQLNDPQVRRLLKESTIKEVKLDLPQDLRQMEPKNLEKIENLRGWLDKQGGKIDQAVGELVKVNKNPDAVIMFGDQEIANGKALFNEKGEFSRIVSGKYNPREGETVKEMNLVGYDFQVEQVKDGADKGKFRVKQTIQAENAPWYAYQNIRAFGIEKIGQPMKIDEKILGPDDFVPVRSGSSVELVKAKNLSAFKEMQQLSYYGEKALTVTMDAAMLASGTIEVGAALKGARLAMTGAESALKLGTREALKEGGKGIVRVAVAGSGIFSNAGAREHEWGRNINTARGVYFLGHIGHGLASSGWNLFRAGKATEAMTSAQKVHSIIAGREAVNGAEALKDIPWVKDIHKGADLAFKATEFGFAPIIATDLAHQVSAIRDAGKKDPAGEAVIQVGDGRGLQQSDKGSFDPRNPKALEAAKKVIDGYSDTLTAGRSQETATQIKEIFEKTKRLMAPTATDAERERYRNELFEKMTFSSMQIAELEKLHPQANQNKDFKLSDQDLHNLMDADKRKDYSRPVAERAEKMMAEKGQNKEVLSARRIALLYLSRDGDGKINPSTATVTTNVPEQRRTINREDDNRNEVEEITVPARTVRQNITSSELVRDMRRDLGSGDAGNRDIATGEVLTRIGGITHQQYAGVLQNVLRNPLATREDKLRALADPFGSRMAAVIDGVRHQESLSANQISRVARERASGAVFGLNSHALMEQLENNANHDKYPDVRAMSAALLYGLREKDAARRAELLSSFNTLAQRDGSEPGRLAVNIQEFLRKESKTEIPQGPAPLADRIKESRLNATLSLAAITRANIGTAVSEAGRSERSGNDGSVSADQAAQRELTKLIAGSFSSTNRELSLRVIDALMPDRMALLDKDKDPLANELRVKAVELLSNPESRAQEAEMVRLAGKLEPFLRDGNVEPRRQLESRLANLLRQNEFNPYYAKDYPLLRSAAIDTLAALGSRSTAEDIRAHASVQTGEQDATVRLAAVKALEKLGDPMLRQTVNELVDKEPDPSVSAHLRDVKFSQQRIEPGSEAWKRMYEKTRADIIGFGKKYPYLDNFDHSAARHWLNSREEFELLDRESYRERAQAAVDNATGWWYRRFSRTSTVNDEEFKKFDEVHGARTAQFDKLRDLAAQGGEEGNKAKMALYFIATQSGSLMGNVTGADADSVRGYYDNNLYHKLDEPDWQTLAATRLKELAQGSVEGKDVVTRALRDGLTSNQEVPGSISKLLLEGWKALGKPDANGRAVSREELAVVTAEALKVEARRRPGSQSPEYQKALIADLKQHKYRMVMPVLQAMIDEPGKISPIVQSAAQDMIDTFSHSTKMMWDDTRTNQTSTAIQRADRLKQALQDKNNAEVTVQEIFDSYKGYKINDPKDPGLAQLQLAMNDTNERVRMAASRILLNADLPDNHPGKLKAMATLANMTLSSSHRIYHQEAYELLNSTKLEKAVMINMQGKIYKLENENGRFKGTEFTMRPGSDQAQPSGLIHPGGESFRWATNERGDLTVVFQNGDQYTRGGEINGKLVGWIHSATGKRHHGDFQVPTVTK